MKHIKITRDIVYVFDVEIDGEDLGTLYSEDVIKLLKAHNVTDPEEVMKTAKETGKSQAFSKRTYD